MDKVMSFYAIYVGIDETPKFLRVEQHPSKDAAVDSAYDHAVLLYEGRAEDGIEGYRTVEVIMEEDEVEEEEAEEIYEDEMESKLEYTVRVVDSLDWKP